MTTIIHRDDVNRVRRLAVSSMSISKLIKLLKTLPSDSTLVGHEQYQFFIQSNTFDLIEPGAICPEFKVEHDPITNREVLKVDTTFNDLLAGL